jgi:hypothetical protein
VVRVNPQQLARADVIPHPGVNPTPRAAVPGRPVAPPPVRPQRVVPLRSLTPARTVPGGTVRPAPPIAKGVPPATRRIPAPGSHVPVPRTASPPLVARTPPPPPMVPFVQRHQAMIEHPGRPLEPPQLDNLRDGRPVGPMLDREFPPHIGPVIPERPAPPPPRLAKPGRP